MDDGLTLSRSQHEESRTARVIRSTVFLFNRFIRYQSHTKPHPGRHFSSISSNLQRPRKCPSATVPSSLPLFSLYSRGLDALSKKGKTSTLDLPIESVSLSLQDLIGYFQPPDEHLEHEDKQNRLRALKNRQNLFQEEVNVPPCLANVGPGYVFHIC